MLIVCVVSDKDKHIAELMRQDMYRLTGALRPLLLTWPGWIKNIQHELAHLEKKMYVKASVLALRSFDHFR